MNVGNQTGVATRLANYDISQNISFDFSQKKESGKCLERQESD